MKNTRVRVSLLKLHFWYGGTSWLYLGQVGVSRSLGQGQHHVQKNDYLLISTCYSFVCTFKAIKKFKVTYQGQGHTSRSRSNQGQHQIEVIFKERYSYVGGLHLNQIRSCYHCDILILMPHLHQCACAWKWLCAWKRQIFKSFVLL